MRAPEEWRPAPGFEGYAISSTGRVMSYKQRPPRLLKGRLDRKGYLQFSLSPIPGVRARNVPAHRLVAEAFIGPRPDGLEIRHLDGNCRNNAVSNLAYGTSGENKRDSVRHGTHRNAGKTQCRNGHHFDERNTYVSHYRGWVTRTCRTCNRAAVRRSKERRAMRAAGIHEVAR